MTHDDDPIDGLLRQLERVWLQHLLGYCSMDHVEKAQHRAMNSGATLHECQKVYAELRGTPCNR